MAAFFQGWQIDGWPINNEGRMVAAKTRRKEPLRQLVTILLLYRHHLLLWTAKNRH